MMRRRRNTERLGQNPRRGGYGLQSSGVVLGQSCQVCCFHSARACVARHRSIMQYVVSLARSRHFAW
eukprot:9480827-Pyramimonas_sp.AAC.1